MKIPSCGFQIIKDLQKKMCKFQVAGFDRFRGNHLGQWVSIIEPNGNAHR